MIIKRMESILNAGGFSQPLSAAKLAKSHAGPRRNLFGRRIDDSSANWVLLTSMAEKAAADWNFDFATGKPLPAGRFLWEPVAAEQGEKENAPSPCLRTGESIDAKSGSKCNKTRLVQSSIKKFMPVHKRRSSSLHKLRSKPRFLSTCHTDYIIHVVDSPRRS